MSVSNLFPSVSIQCCHSISLWQPRAISHPLPPFFSPFRHLWKFVTRRKKRSPFARFVIDELHFVPSIPNGFVMFFFLNLSQELLHEILKFAPAHRTNVWKTSLVQNTWNFFFDWKQKKKKKTKLLKCGYFTHWPSLFNKMPWHGLIDGIESLGVHAGMDLLHLFHQR